MHGQQNINMSLLSLFFTGQLPTHASNIKESRYATVLLPIILFLLVFNRELLPVLFILFFSLSLNSFLVRL